MRNTCLEIWDMQLLNVISVTRLLKDPLLLNVKQERYLTWRKLDWCPGTRKHKNGHMIIVVTMRSIRDLSCVQMPILMKQALKRSSTHAVSTKQNVYLTQRITYCQHSKIKHCMILAFVTWKTQRSIFNSIANSMKFYKLKKTKVSS